MYINNKKNEGKKGCILAGDRVPQRLDGYATAWLGPQQEGFCFPTAHTLCG